MNQSRVVERKHKDIPPQCGKTRFMKYAHLRKERQSTDQALASSLKKTDHKCMLETL